MRTYEIKNETKYWATKASAERVAQKLFDEGDETLWVSAWESDKGWFLENLEELDIYNNKVR